MAIPLSSTYPSCSDPAYVSRPLLFAPFSITSAFRLLCNHPLFSPISWSSSYPKLTLISTPQRLLLTVSQNTRSTCRVILFKQHLSQRGIRGIVLVIVRSNRRVGKTKRRSGDRNSCLTSRDPSYVNNRYETTQFNAQQQTAHCPCFYMRFNRAQMTELGLLASCQNTV